MIFGPLELVLVIVGLGLAVPLLRRGPRRGWVILGVYMAAFLGAGALPMPIGLSIRTGMIFAYPFLVAVAPEVLLGQTRSESALERELSALMTSLADPLRWWRGETGDDVNQGRQQVARASAAALSRWHSLQVPSTRWAETYRLAGEYLDAVRTSSTVPGLAGEEASDRADQLVGQYLAAWQRATGRRP